MRRFQLGAIFTTCFFCSCSAYDFFDYENNTGLYAIERPDGYGSAKLGTEMAPTGTAEFDLLAASGGLGTATLVYKLSAGGKLRKVSDPFDSYLSDDNDEKERKVRGTGISLAGLPDWAGRQQGCVAVGEPERKQVVVRCVSDPEKDKIVKLSESTAGGDLTDFGRRVASVRPAGGGQWLLVVAARRHMWAMSDQRNIESNRTAAFSPKAAGGSPAGEVEALAAGRLHQKFYVASLVSGNLGAPQVYVFVQDSVGGKTLTQTLCLVPQDGAVLSGALTTGDINGDGADELVVSAGLGQVGTKKVYVYDVAELVATALPTASTCTSAGALLAKFVLEPEEGDLDVNCGDNCHFGSALAVGDISTEDSYGEIVVGAPEANVRGVKEAGAVYIYSVSNWTNGQAELSSQVAHSSPSRGHWFGGGLAITPLAGRNELVIASTGKGNLYVAFCTGVGNDIDVGADVPTNAGGSVVSTRCRL